MRLLNWLLKASVLAITLSAILVAVIYHYLSKPINLSQDAVFRVEAGDSSIKIGQKLQDQKIIEYPQLTRIVSRLDPTLVPKVGEYQLEPGMNVFDVMALINSGKSIFYSVTLLEGKTTQEFINLLAARGNIEMTLTDLNNEQIAAKLELDVNNAEGVFFANTYRYHDGDTDQDILLRAYKMQQQVLTELWQEKAKELPYESPYEALIMASIVEKETGVASERPLIARVFISRLEKRMRLQTDPTVIYGLGDDFNGNLTRKGLRHDSPYNTYRVFGLPPTPIANVGKEAIAAALNPGETKALYFVAKGDGSHAFSNTLKQHNQAVAKYQYKRRSDYRSSPKAE
ncbi:endolytic transglycosylase MltG [Marinomonas epiphytica]